jgi:signal transduction histidine kinase
LAIVDEDPAGHAEWHNLRQTAPEVAPGDRLVLEWNELFSMGMTDTRSATYTNLPAGDFQFKVQEVTALGLPTGREDSVRIHVALPLQESPLFWPAVLTILIGAVVAASRYLAWYRMRREVAHLRQQQALEQERLRIAQDIHDDLGARVTQIALLSGMAQDNPALPENARAEFNQVSRLTRDLISALYETVWAVNPENDNLDALGNYLCQMVNELCRQARLRCRFELCDLPRDIQISSQTRHNITMAVKEGIHNVIKHAEATELTLRVDFDGRVLSISIQDDGNGFCPPAHPGGNGLRNMKQRLADVGGTCCVLSEPGQKTRVEMSLKIQI